MTVDTRAMLSIISKLYRYNGLSFRAALVPSIFSKWWKIYYRVLPGVTVHIHDILVKGKSIEEYLHNLETVLHSLEKAGLCLKREKCSFMLSSVGYLGYKILEKGLQLTDEKITAIKNVSILKMSHNSNHFSDSLTVILLLHILWVWL